LIDVDRLLGVVGRESVSAETVLATVAFAAAFASVLGEAPAAALRFLTGFSAGGADGSPVKKKVGSVICDRKGNKEEKEPFRHCAQAPVELSLGGTFGSWKAKAQIGWRVNGSHAWRGLRTAGVSTVW
jgi:hypothetical protein